MKKSTILIIVIVALVGGAGYFYFMGTKSPESETIDVDPAVQASASRVLILLTQIKSLRIDPKLFSSAEYQTLRDYTVSIPPLPVGRPNPFAPVPGMTVSSGAANASASRSGSSSTRR